MANPPKWTLFFLKKTCSEEFLDELEGDLMELYERDIMKFGIRKARRKFMTRALFSPRWYRLPFFQYFQSSAMWKNHFKMAYRHAFRHKLSSAINLSGLILGIAAVFYIGLFIKDQLSFDKMHLEGEHIYRVLRSNPLNDKKTVVTSSQHGQSLSETFPFINVCRFGNDPVKMGDKHPLLIDEFYWADSTFFDFFSFKMIQGNPETCLKELNSVVITRSLSEQLFGTATSLDKILKVKVYDGDQEYQMRISGVIEDPPKNSHIQFRALGAMANAEELYSELIKSWGFSWLRTYIKVPENRLPEIKAALPDLMADRLGPEMARTNSMAFQAFYDIHLYSRGIQRSSTAGDIRFLYIFGAIGLLILFISISNYINLTTARASMRAKEVSIRKVLGTKKLGIIRQFIIESVVLTGCAGIAAVLLMMLSIERLNAFLELDLSYYDLSPGDWLFIFLSIIALGIITGLLPSISIAKLNFFSKGNSAIQFKAGLNTLTRKMFLGFQYLITLVLVASALIVFQQYSYLKNFDLGFDTSQLMHIPVNDRFLQKKLHVIQKELAQLPGVLGVTTTSEDLPSEHNNTWGLNWADSLEERTSNIEIVGVDKNYFELTGIDFVSGRNFTSDFAIDSAGSVIINEKAQNIIGLGELEGQYINIGDRNRKVIGVVKDHHNTSLHSQIRPIAFFIFPPATRVSPDNILIKLEVEQLSGLTTEIEKIWKKFTADPLTFNFVDEAFSEAYQRERRFSKLVSCFTVIAIIISLIGLFGLISFTTQSKIKELSIRRILGATDFNLMKVLGWEFISVYFVAIIIALPLTFYLMQAWLANYAYRIHLNGQYLFLSAIICFSISMIVLFYHLQKTSRQNPGEVLSTE